MRSIHSDSTTERQPNWHKLFDVVPTAYLVVSPEMEILAASDKYLRITENQREKIVGRSLDRDFSRNPNGPWIGDVRKLKESLRRVRETGKPHRFLLREANWDREKLPGSFRRIWRATNTPICDHSGSLVYILHRLEKVNDPSRSRRVRCFARRLIAMQEQDRARIARELHDQMAQNLSAMMLELESLKTKSNPQELEIAVDHIQDLIQHVGEEVHRLAWDLRPAPIEEVGFRESLRGCVEELSLHSSLQLDFHSNLTAEDRFDPSIETICYRIIQESLANIVKHAKATSASVIVTRQGFELKIIVEDDGIGFEAIERRAHAIDHHHVGLRGMRERLALIGGSLQIESTVGRGTSLFARLPLRQAGAP